MADFTLTIADADLPRVLSALCTNFGYDEVSDVNALAAVMTFITNVVSRVETIAAQQAAIAALPVVVPPVLSGPAT